MHVFKARRIKTVDAFCKSSNADGGNRGEDGSGFFVSIGGYEGGTPALFGCLFAWAARPQQ
eukprot:303485-Rhodomonas_salina.3